MHHSPVLLHDDGATPGQAPGAGPPVVVSGPPVGSVLPVSAPVDVLSSPVLGSEVVVPDDDSESEVDEDEDEPPDVESQAVTRRARRAQVTRVMDPS